MLRAVAFIDGENLRYSLMDFRREHFPKHQRLFGTPANPYLREVDVDWEKFLAHIVPPDHRLIRAYWYKAGQLSEWYKPAANSEVGRRWVSKHLRIAPDRLTEPQIQGELDRAERWYNRERDRHREILRSHNFIMVTYNIIEFRYQGILQVDPLGEDRIGERGVDIALAVDMISMVRDYDLAILVTGDIDFAPAIQAVKNNLRQVVQVAVGPRLPPFIGKARKLREMADYVLPVFGDEIIPNMLLKEPQPPAEAPPSAEAAPGGIPAGNAGPAAEG